MRDVFGESPASELIDKFYQDLMAPKPVPSSAQVATLYAYKDCSRHLVGTAPNCTELWRLLNDNLALEGGRKSIKPN